MGTTPRQDNIMNQYHDLPDSKKVAVLSLAMTQLGIITHEDRVKAICYAMENSTQVILDRSKI